MGIQKKRTPSSGKGMGARINTHLYHTIAMVLFQLERGKSGGRNLYIHEGGG